MQQLKLNGQNTQAKKGFWARQFDEEPTNSQKKFDWIFGVFLPAVCFFFDPIVFDMQGHGMGKALLGNYKPFAYILCYFSLFAMSMWLSLGNKVKWFSAILSGIFLIGGVISLIVGIILIPFSLMGLVLLIGILGFTPLLTSFVYLRNTVRAFHLAESDIETKKLVSLFVGIAVLSLIIPLISNFQINKNLQQIINGDAQDVYANARTLKLFAPIVNFESLTFYYYRDGIKDNPEKLEAIATIYQDLTGRDIKTESLRYD